MSLQVKYVDVPLGAKEVASASASACQRFGSEQQLIAGTVDMPWATLEPDSWKLDGSRVILPAFPENIGWWSLHRSGEDGRFVHIPTIQIFLPQAYTATGITFDFWASLGHWCSELTVVWYKDGAVLREVTAFPDSAHWVLDQLVEDFDRVDIRLLATNCPGHFAKIQQIQIGQIAIFEADELVQVRLLQEIDPSMCELSVDTLTVTVRDRKNRVIFPQKNQSVQLYRDGQLLASHYVSDFSRQGQRDYQFRCKSTIGRLEDLYLGGRVLNNAGGLLAELLPDIPYQIDSELAWVELNGYLPICTRREALQQLAFAIGAVVTTRADGTICLRLPESEQSGSFVDDRIFMGAKVTQKPRIAQVQLLAHGYYLGEKREVLLNEETVSGENVLYLFSQPHYEYEIVGGILTGWGENWVTITADGPVTLTALNYIHTTTAYVKTNPKATPEEQGNTVVIKNATLVGKWIADGVLQRLYNHYTQRNLLQQQVVLSGQQIGQLVRSANPWSTDTEGHLVSMESDFTGTGQTAQITILGKEVPRN